MKLLSLPLYSLGGYWGWLNGNSPFFSSFRGAVEIPLTGGISKHEQKYIDFSDVPDDFSGVPLVVQMEEEASMVEEKEGPRSSAKIDADLLCEGSLCPHMDRETLKGFGDSKTKDETEAECNLVVEKGECSNVVFCREAPIWNKELTPADNCGCAKKLKTRISSGKHSIHGKNRNWDYKKLCRQDRIELGRMFQGAVSSHDWELAESLIHLADPQSLNDSLCIALDSMWFLMSQEELNGVSGLIRRIITNGAYDFTRAALRTSFLASCVYACQSQTMSLADTVNAMSQRLHERLQECDGDEVLKAEAGAKVQKFTEWALRCIGFYSRSKGNNEKVNLCSEVEIELQLSAFKTFLDLSGNHLTGKDFTEAFDAACFPLTLFSSSFDPGWGSGIAATAVRGLLGMLVEGGADNVNQCFLEASRFGSTELVRILLQIAQRNSLDVDVDLALGFASHYSKISTMECLVDDGHATAFLGPLMRAAERGCMPVVHWFVQRGCRDMELCLALTSATSSSQVQVAGFLLPHIPAHVLSALSVEILNAAGEHSSGLLDGVHFLLRSNFLSDADATYAVADRIAKSLDESVTSELRAFLNDQWSEAAFLKGMAYAQDHYVNMMRVVVRGSSPLSLGELPAPLRMVISYLPLYRECARDRAPLVSQWIRGQLLEAAQRLTNEPIDETSHGSELLKVLEHFIPPFLR